VGFEPTIPDSERAKTVHALDRSAVVTGLTVFSLSYNFVFISALNGPDHFVICTSLILTVSEVESRGSTLVKLVVTTVYRAVMSPS
jgi:hypothetical protein